MRAETFTTAPTITAAGEETASCGCRLWRRRERRPRVGRHLPMVSALALILVPKCPMCLVAYIGLLGWAGVRHWANAVWGVPLEVGLLATAVISLAVGACRSRNPWPLVVGLVGAGTLLAGKCLIASPLMLAVGPGLLAAAWMWSERVVAWGAGSRSLGLAHK